MILDRARRGKSVGALARLAGSSTVDTTPTSTNAALRERLSGALNDLERAERAGDADAVHFHEFRVDRIRAEARAARTAGEPAGEHPGFDGGVQRVSRPPLRREETATELMLRAMTQSHIERAERPAELRAIKYEL